MRLAQSNGCYSWAQVQPNADGWRCGPLQQAAAMGGLQATAVILVPLAVDTGDPDLEGGSIEFYREESGRFAFGLFWIDAEQTFENGTGACLSGEDVDCQIRGRFLFDTPPLLATPEDFNSIQLVDFDADAPVAVILLVD